MFNREKRSQRANLDVVVGASQCLSSWKTIRFKDVLSGHLKTVIDQDEKHEGFRDRSWAILGSCSFETRSKKRKILGFSGMVSSKFDWEKWRSRRISGRSQLRSLKDTQRTYFKIICILRRLAFFWYKEYFKYNRL